MVRLIGKWFCDDTRYDYIPSSERPKYKFAKIVSRSGKDYLIGNKTLCQDGQVELYSSKKTGVSEIPGMRVTYHYMPDRKIGRAKGIVVWRPRFEIRLDVLDERGYKNELKPWDKERPMGITYYNNGD